MKPILDISAKNSFTVWESCVWRDTFSSSIVVADEATNKLQVIYDRDPLRSSTHALFYNNVGNILAGCFINKRRSPRVEGTVRVELVRVESLSTKEVQGHTIPDAKLEPLYLTSASCIKCDELDIEEILGSYKEKPSLPNAYALMTAAIQKAMTPPSQQKLFWGIPRQKVEQD